MSIAITDLDELTLRVRDAESKILYAEAVQAYRAGAFRSAVTADWIAVVYDLIAKIRELSLGGDKNAAKFVEALDRAVVQEDVFALQKIESGILDTAASEFELLLAHEKVDLERLRDDRNLCAHPALVAEHIVFQPAPELVRAHLVHVGLHVLRHPPVQGKAALDSIKAEISRSSFPEERERAFVVIGDRIGRAKEALVRNLVLVLLKALIYENDSDLSKKPVAIVNSLLAIGRIHGLVYERVMKEALGSWPSTLNDEQLASVLRLVGAESRAWNWLSDPTRIRAMEIVKKLPATSLARAGVFDALSIEALREAILAKVSSLDAEEKISVIAENPRPEFADEAIRLYSRVAGFRAAQSIGEGVILPMARYFSAEQISEILSAAKENSQIWFAGGTPDILARFFDLTVDRVAKTKDAWREFVETMLLENRNKGWNRYPELQERLQRHSIPYSVPGS